MFFLQFREFAFRFVGGGAVARREGGDPQVVPEARRVGGGFTKNGCGYTLQVAERKYRAAADALREAGLRPVRVFRVVNGASQEVMT